MRISEHFASVSLAAPRALPVLERLEGRPVYHEAYGLRHPLAAYRISLSAVSAAALKVLERLGEVRVGEPGSRGGGAIDALLEATDQWLDSLMEHLDDCRGVLRSQFAPGDTGVKQVLLKYKQSVKPYRDHVGRVDNYLKHNQGRLRPVSFAWGSGSCHGYYVEGPIGLGLGPAEEIHGPDGTAFSYNRDMPFHLCHVYAVSDRLAAALVRAHPDVADVEGSSTPSDVRNVVELTARLPRVYFPDEIRKPVPLVELSGESCRMEYPSSETKVAGPPFAARVTTSARGDGVTKRFKLPYLKRPSS